MMSTTFNPKMPEDAAQLGDEIYQRLRANYVVESRTDSFYDDRVPAWFSKLIASLVLLVGDDKIEDLFMSAAHESPTMTVVILTKNHLVRSSVTINTKATGGEPSVEKNSAIARSRLRQLSVAPAYGVFSDRPRPWPGNVTITAIYDGEEEPVLFNPDPTRRADHPEQDIARALKSLLSDLDG